MYFVQAARVPLAKVVLASEHKISSEHFLGGEMERCCEEIPKTGPASSLEQLEGHLYKQKIPLFSSGIIFEF